METSKNKISFKSIIFFLSFSILLTIISGVVFVYFSTNAGFEKIFEITKTDIPFVKKMHELKNLEFEENFIFHNILTFKKNKIKSSEQEKKFTEKSNEMDEKLKNLLVFFQKMPKNNENYDGYIFIYRALKKFEKQHFLFQKNALIHFENEKFSKITNDELKKFANDIKVSLFKILVNVPKITEKITETTSKEKQALQNSLFWTSCIFCFVVIIIAYILFVSSTRQLQNIMTTLGATFQNVAKVSAQINHLTFEMSDGAHEQALSIEKIADILGHVTVMTEQNNGSTKTVGDISNKTKKLAELGYTTVRNLNKTMGNVAGFSKKMQDIITTVREIAVQTNILSLNASVEASKAGDSGKGFSVIANEIGRLAEKSSECVGFITTLIDDATHHIDDGVDAAINMEGTFENIFERIQDLTIIIKEISIVSSEQAMAMKKAKNSVTEIDKMVQAAAINTEESTSVAQKLKVQSHELEKAIDELHLIA